MRLEEANLRADDERSRLGMKFAAILTLMISCMGTYIAAIGHPEAGAAIAAIPNAGLIMAFIYGKQSQRKERSERLKAMIGR